MHVPYHILMDLVSESAPKGRIIRTPPNHSLLDEGKITLGTRDASDHQEKLSSFDDFQTYLARKQPRKNIPQHHSIQYLRRRVESNLAAIMMGYVLVFLICNFPRLMLNIDELARIR